MRKIKIGSGVVVVLAIIISILLSNKAKSAASARSDKLTSVPVTLFKAEIQELTKPIVLVGTITANNDVAVVSETQGRVTQVAVGTGDYVQMGASLIQVDDELKKAAFDLAQANYEKAKRDLDRNEELYKDHTITESQIESTRLAYRAAESQYIVARRQLNDTRITSPISGYINERKVNMGTMVMPGMTIANIVDVSKLKVKVNLSEKDAFRVKVGDPVTVTTEVYPETEFSGRITSISAKADEAHTYPLEIELANSAKHPLKSGMFGRVLFKSRESSESIVVPRDAIIGSIKEPEVYVVERGVAKLRKLTIGNEAAGMVAVLNGLAVGDQVVMSGHSNLQDGVEVTVLK
ncbi:MAG: efflux RND transporter periplasmic adaptor subunit [Bacteroidetes bacterium]|nr:efflux RND transporter periplasmic adaptor subunit [Bacteroidota bacterium]